MVGRDAYVIFVADAPDGVSDLFGVRADGGRTFQITFTPVREARPALSPDGSMVAFLRGRRLGDTLAATPWVMNLLSGAERRLELPVEVRADAMGWGAEGKSLYVRSGRFAYVLPAPPAEGPAEAVAPDRWGQVDSALGVFVGEPKFARIVQCGRGLCAARDSGNPAPIADRGRDPARWGSDSVGYFAGDELIVRPLGPGRSRRVAWDRPPPNPRELTVFHGAGTDGNSQERAGTVGNGSSR